MIKKISNWVFGSFFRTIGRILVYIIVGYLLSILLSNYDITGFFNILEVHATQTERWFYNIENSGANSFYWINHTSNGHEFITNALVYWDMPSNHEMYNYTDIMRRYQFPSTPGNVNIASNGVAFAWQTDMRLKKDYLYSINSYICASSNIDNVSGYLTLGSSASNSIGNNNNYSTTIVNQLGDVIGYNTSESLYNCITFNSLIVPRWEQNWANLNITSNTNINARLYFIGYDIEELGMYDEAVKSMFRDILSSSGFATANSISQVQSSINNVQTQINQTNSAINQQTQQQQQNHDETMNTLKDDNTNESQNTATSFFNNFNTNNHGLTGIITAPLNAIQSLSNKTCTPLVLPLPYVNQNLTLPCMREIYVSNFAGFINLYDIITTGIVAYWVCVRIFGLVKDFKNPEHDEIEVVDL